MLVITPYGLVVLNRAGCALLMEISVLVFLLIFTYAFNWAFGKIFGLPESAH